jgi:23S rRNA (guanosine2251-2'-O)-methyltransferase
VNKDSKNFSKKPRPSRAGKPGPSAASGGYKRTSTTPANGRFKKARNFSARPNSSAESAAEPSSDKSRDWKPRSASSSRFSPQSSSTRKPYQRAGQSTDRPRDSRDEQGSVRKPFRRSEQESDRPRTGQSSIRKPYQRVEQSADRPRGSRDEQSSERKPFRRSEQDGATARPKWNDRGGAPRPTLKSSSEFAIQKKSGATSPVEESPPEDETELLYGKQPVRSALEKGRTLNRLWIIDQLRYDGRFLPLIEEAKNKGTVIDVVDRKRLDQITQGENHQGVVAQVAAYTYWELEDLIQQSAKDPEPMILVLDGIEDPQNLGSLIRTAEALGVNGLIIPQRRASGVTATVSRVAAGAVEHLAIARVVNLNQALERLKEAGYWVVGAEASGERSVSAMDLKGPLVVVVGSEGKGISLLTQKLCDFICHIPLKGRTPSLNAGVAGGIILYEVSRQRATRTIKMELT